MKHDRFTATYLIETTGDPQRAAVEMAGEQSTSTEGPIAGESREVIRRHGSRIEALETVGEGFVPSLPVDDETPAGAATRARVTLSWPVANVGPSLPALMTTLLGNQTGLRTLTGIRLERFDLPDSYVAVFPRPAFGIAGTRRRARLDGRPLIGAVVKPNIGLSPDETSEAVKALLDVGVDFIKDDELMANPPYAPLKARVSAIMPILKRAEDKTGRRAIYAFNVTGDADELRWGHDHVLAEGGDCVMVNLNAVGLAGFVSLRRHSQLIIHGHRAGWASLTRHPLLGLDFSAYQTLWRLAGVDQLHVSGFGRKFWESGDSIRRAARACLTPLSASGPDDRAMPVFSGGSKARDVPETLDAAGGTDLIFVAGSAVFGHPGGLAAGCAALQQAWEAAMMGEPLENYAKGRPALRQALETWPIKAPVGLGKKD